MKLMCSICARGGSKGVKNKNIRTLVDRPLIAHSLEQAHATGLFDVIVVSSDSDDILQVSQDYGAQLVIKRPDELATDTAAKIPVIQHCMQETEAQTGQMFDYVVDLSATAPMRTADDIKGVVALQMSDDISNVITAAEAKNSPYFSLVELNETGVPVLSKPPSQPLVRRQDSPKCFDMNGSIYSWTRSDLLHMTSLFGPKTRLFEMPEERSFDIDTETDFIVIETLMSAQLS